LLEFLVKIWMDKKGQKMNFWMINMRWIRWQTCLLMWLDIGIMILTNNKLLWNEN
jgi:hypothetical protein